MPMRKQDYPKNWEEISRRIRFERAKGKCEWCGAEHGKPHPKGGYKCVLTTAHLGVPKPDGSPGDKNDKMDCRDENLAALCQDCHLRFDSAQHAENARRTRAKKKKEELERAGQKPLLTDTDTVIATAANLSHD